MDSLKGMAIFATVVDKGSMAAAAQSLGMTPSACLLYTSKRPCS